MRPHVARKRFGQNFLVSAGIVAKIVEAIRPQPGDLLVEIGPGLGALTEPLLARLDHLHVVEIDRDLIARLRQRFTPDRLTVHEGDALQFDFFALGPGLRVAGNLPYNISTPLLFHLAACADGVRDMHFMLQREVVERMVAAPGGAEYGRLSVMLQYRFEMERLFRVPPGAFNPAPKVESAVVRMVPRPRATLDASDEVLLGEVVKSAFAQRRKMLRNTLREHLNEEDWVALGLDPRRRAEELAVGDYVRIANRLAGLRLPPGRPKEA
ncbi:MAG: ribosomal RNA small subunit methyltransferase A [Rhodocyclaceae bacterium]|jgi:16S rRNA (adenine1518-N6/adenine1519-N6)-dimethyltransferase|uniref:Ribosomal RNA small subunit methyltransferase A n=1 Tax=Candidatus Desulfobacillus denitrificans TaxID=2608985 RepID=A0A809R531_9PROT|nr:16S rRNA (adenine(1518)-N(6)/adenine(1519)-N(6)) -dimethyltransferase RsmA [Candidatus Desulfobacillus denitrificans]GIK45179.1 MAG: ribosomal RNA small subunit methyltransferase A [Betaproteobacteria bacterium]GJQ55648.1 MAG: ribosomal RNA small subunit methyltransferase A [Rhodocyclaceae bacterium]